MKQQKGLESSLSIKSSNSTSFMRPKTNSSLCTTANNSTIAGNEEMSIKIKKELKEKSKIIEDKIRELRSKESEYSRVIQQKDKLVKEVGTTL